MTPSGGDASVSRPSRAGAVLLHVGPAAWSRAGSRRPAGPAARHADADHHPAWTDHHHAAAAGPGNSCKEGGGQEKEYGHFKHIGSSRFRFLESNAP